MKKTVLLLVLGLASLSLSAQSRMSYSWEFVAGVGVGKGPQFSFTPEFIAQYDFEDLVFNTLQRTAHTNGHSTTNWMFPCLCVSAMGKRKST